MPQEAEAKTSHLGKLEAWQVRKECVWLPEPQGEQWGARPGDCVHGEGSLVLRNALCGMWMKQGRRLAVAEDGDCILLGECG